MMHHPNMHHQPMSGPPPQHLPGPQGMPTHHQMPPHQMHRENRVPMGPSQPGGGMTTHGQAMGGMGAMGVHPPHHGPSHRPPHPIRAMPHHPPAQHHSVPPQQMKALRRPYGMSGGYGPTNGPGVMPPHYVQPPPMQPPPTTQTNLTVVTTSSTTAASSSNTTSSGGEGPPAGEEGVAGSGRGAEGEVAGETEAARPPVHQANSKEKTPMCLVNELARYNKIKHQYRLTSETGPAHKKVFTVTLRLGDTEEYTAEGSSIKRAQHAAAAGALAATHFPPPPPRAPPAHPATHPHHRHAVMPTVELNALAMKLCQPAVYTSIPPVTAMRGGPRMRGPSGFRLPSPMVGYRMGSPGFVYRVRVCVGGRAWLGEGVTPQAARHDAAARALHDLRPPPDPPAPTTAQTQDGTENGDASPDLLNSEVKSPVSLVHELALKRNLSVQFSVKSERGPPHMRVFVTTCTVGDMETDGEGNGKKVSKRRAAERMLEEMRRRWPPALLRPRLHHDKRRPQPTKKKPRNLIKEGGVCRGEGDGGADNPISRLAMARHAARARSPQYRLVEERGIARRREFIVQCDAPPHCATGLGPNKKTAKRRAAHNVLVAMKMANSTDSTTSTKSDDAAVNGTTDSTKISSPDPKGKESEGSTGGSASEVRQPVPGVLLMDYHQRSGQPPPPNGVSETSATGGGGNSPGAKDQLMYLSQLLGFTVQFSDFPKRNHGEYLSLVSLSTEPPVMCHGGGPSTAHSHEQCSRAALRALALMGLDATAPATAPAPATSPATATSPVTPTAASTAPTSPATPQTATQSVQSMPLTGAKQSVISNGISE